MSELLLSSTLLASFLGGVVALLAPCCVSVMLPAYFASAFRRRSRIVAMTLLFALGVATVILPIALGATALSRVIAGQHTVVFSVMGLLMLLGGLAMLAGWKFALPMIPIRVGAGGSIGSVYALGAFSGIASACCAPVLVGVVAVSGAVSSFPAALAVGVAYVFGMVAPLAVLALLWDRHQWGHSSILSGRTLTIGWGRFRRAVPLATALSGILLVAMGALTLVLAVRGPAMATDGWQVRMTAALNHASSSLQRAIDWVPGWLTAAVVTAALAGFVYAAVRPTGSKPSDPDQALSEASVQTTPPVTPSEQPKETS